MGHLLSLTWAAYFSLCESLFGETNRLLRVLDHAGALGVEFGESLFGEDEALLGSFRVPKDALHRIRSNARAQIIHLSKAIFGFSGTLCGSTAEPRDGRAVIFGATE